MSREHFIDKPHIDDSINRDVSTLIYDGKPHPISMMESNIPELVTWLLHLNLSVILSKGFIQVKSRDL